MNSVKTCLLTALAALIFVNGAGGAEDGLAAFEGQNVKNITFELIDCPWNGYDLQVLAYDMISLDFGDAFTAKAYEQSLSKLKVSDRFTAIDAEVRPVAGGVHVIFRLKPAWVLADVQFKGIYPLFETEVLKGLSLHIGDPLNIEILKAQEELVRELYRREGFAEPKVRARLKLDHSKGRVVLVLKVEPGPCYRLGHVELEGNHYLSDEFILIRMQSWWGHFILSEGRRFREADFEADLKRLQSYYWRKGYVECRIDHEIVRDEQNRTVAARITIDEGPRYKVKFTGNQKIRDYRLRRELSIRQQGNRRDRGLKRDLKAIGELYHAQGYLEQSAQISKDNPTDGRQRVIFAIDEGGRSTLAQVSFEGNRAFSSRELRAVMPSLKGLGAKAYVPENIALDLEAIRSRYREAGYGSVAVFASTSWQGKRASLTISIDEGPRTLISGIDFEGLEPGELYPAYQATGLEYGQALSPRRREQAETSLAGWVSDQGYPHVKVASTAVLNADGTRADLRFAVERGQHVTMGGSFYQGNFKTRKRTLRHALDLNKGEPFSLSHLYAAQKNLRDMGVFESVKFKTLGLKEGDERVTLIVDVEETAPYYVQGGAGYTSDRGLYAASRFGDRNLNGLAINSWLGGELSQIGHKFDAHLSQQRTLNTRLSTAYNYSYEKKEEFNQDFGTKVSGASLLLGWPFDELRLKSGLEVRYERREAYPVEYSARLAATNYTTRKIVVTTPSLSYDSRDSFVRPTRGWLGTVSLDASRGIESDYDDFNRYRFKLRYFTSPAAWLTLALAGDYAHIDPCRSARLITADQLLYQGGTMTVRGYGENLLRHDAADSPVGGRESAAVSLEARCAISPHWELSLFVDSGSVRAALPESPGSECWRSSAGLGLRYITPIGPMGLLYGHKLNPADGDEGGRLHFSLGYTF